jgi:hypothetical protein
MWREHHRQVITPVFVYHESQHHLAHASGRIQALSGEIVRGVEHQFILTVNGAIGDFQLLRNSSFPVGQDIEYGDSPITVDTAQNAANTRGMSAAQRIENM